MVVIRGTKDYGWGDRRELSGGDRRELVEEIAGARRGNRGEL